MLSLQGQGQGVWEVQEVQEVQGVQGEGPESQGLSPVCWTAGPFS